jgi:hypothetical protein
MGQLKRQVLGDVFGAVGHLVFKNRGGTNYISQRPVSYATPQDPRSVLIRNQFRMISKLSKSLNSYDLIKKIWREKYPECYSIYHKIFDSNYHRFNFNNFYGNPYLTPDKGFKLEKPKVELNGANLIITADPILPDSGVDFSKNNFIAAASFLMVRYHNSPNDTPVFHPIKGKIIPLDLTQPILLETEINSPNVIVPKDEYIARSWSVLIILDEKLNPTSYSETLIWLPD